MRSYHYDFIQQSLLNLGLSIEANTSNNLTNLNIHTENLLVDFLNTLYGLQLINLNTISRNQPAIDLVDYKNKLIVQVTSAFDKYKITSTINRIDLSQFAGYRLRFIILRNNIDIKELKINLAVPDTISFDLHKDIVDFSQLCSDVFYSSNATIAELYNQMLGLNPAFGSFKNQFSSDVAKVVNILAELNSNDCVVPVQDIEFEIIQKIKYNELEKLQNSIADFLPYTIRLNDVYRTLQDEGELVKNSVIRYVRLKYEEISHLEDKSNINNFYALESLLLDFVQKSQNYNRAGITMENLHICIRIILIDAFISCKIFENPSEG